MFRGQCMNCHTMDGYRSIRKLMSERDHKGIENLLHVLHEDSATSPYRNFMPPLTGTPAEIAALADYLDHEVHPAAGPVVARK